jgi:hypothetical protein
VSTAGKLIGFAALVVVLFAAAVGAGKAIDPGTGTRKNAKPEGHGMNGMAEDHGTAGARGEATGLAVADRDLRLIPETTTLERGRQARFVFRVADRNGRTVRDFELEHTRRMHTIVVRRDMAGYQHVHPRQLPDGRWTVNLRLSDPGVYRLYADFARRDGSHTLATDVFVPGRFDPRPFPAPSSRTTVDGYDIALRRSGEELNFEISRDGRSVDVEPYLGADGHLVALRQGDLAFLHVHPLESNHAADISFEAHYPSPGSYRLFLQFKHHGRVHTAEFTQEAA